MENLLYLRRKQNQAMKQEEMVLIPWSSGPLTIFSMIGYNYQIVPQTTLFRPAKSSTSLQEISTQKLVVTLNLMAKKGISWELSLLELVLQLSFAQKACMKSLKQQKVRKESNLRCSLLILKHNLQWVQQNCCHLKPGVICGRIFLMTGEQHM